MTGSKSLTKLEEAVQVGTGEFYGTLPWLL